MNLDGHQHPRAEAMGPWRRWRRETAAGVRSNLTRASRLGSPRDPASWGHCSFCKRCQIGDFPPPLLVAVIFEMNNSSFDEKATAIVIWLGSSSSDIGLLMELIGLLSKRVRRKITERQRSSLAGRMDDIWSKSADPKRRSLPLPELRRKGSNIVISLELLEFVQLQV